MEDVNLARWSAEFEELMRRIGPRFARAEPRARVCDYIAGLVSGLQRKNSWWLAEHAGEAGPDGMQRLLRKARFDVDAIRNDLAAYVAERLGEDDGVLILDETGFVKKGRASVGVARQYSGTAGRVENSQIALFAAYASDKGHALVDRELYLPKEWIEAPARCEAAGVPAERIAAGTLTKPRLAQAVIERAEAAGLAFRWVTADAVYGSAKYLRVWLETRDRFHVLAIRGKDDVVIGFSQQRAQAVIAALPASAWQRLSVGAGSHGPRRYDWARIPVRFLWRPGRGHWLLARRSIADPRQIAYYICYGPRRSSLTDLAWIAGTRWKVEECFQQAKDVCGLDQYQARTWRAWHAHVTFAMIAHALLAATRAAGAEKGATRQSEKSASR
ncbi:IS701 family transposase [Glycomyces tenuis]|uniref:IS701 family transposase n=1 Tax=Glycomyces tenuis TaxID=58116 RepID=UPI00047AD9F9|nr:IS701 family transposase [Glycomyces tenuis]